MRTLLVDVLLETDLTLLEVPVLERPHVRHRHEVVAEGVRVDIMEIALCPRLGDDIDERLQSRELLSLNGLEAITRQ